MAGIKLKNIIQVAGIIDQKEADMIISYGVDYLGFPLRLPVNKEDLSENAAAEIIRKIPPPHSGVIISYSKTAEEATKLCKKLVLNCSKICKAPLRPKRYGSVDLHGRPRGFPTFSEI